jgi:cellulose synthase/poly-beta-1,6-N-acetylglucosamine synthase-like glycosyltransferase
VISAEIWTECVFIGMALLLAIPIGLFVLECFGAALWGRSQRSTGLATDAPTLAVLVPAHNEALGIRQTLENLLTHLQAGDRLVVVADNCNDDTAAIAQATGATVIERVDASRRGKGYALDFGIRFLDHHPPDIVVIVDADCQVEPGALTHIARQSWIQKRPVQAVYLLEQPAQPKPKDAISALAFMVKNLVRPLGLQQIGMPCLLTGTGMAFPWEIIRSMPLASGNIVEDMQLSLDLAIAGYPPQLCPSARIWGTLPQQSQAAISQRTRWEHGHLATIQTQVPRLLREAWQQKRVDLFILGLDLAIPPLAMLVVIWLGLTLLAAIALPLTGAYRGFTLLVLEGIGMSLAIAVAWATFCRAQVPFQTLLAIPLYMLWKIPLYFKFLVQPQTKWVRTERDRTDSSKI